ADDADEGDHPRRQGVGTEEAVECHQRLAPVHRHGDGERAYQGQHRSRGVQRRRETPDRAPREDGPGQRDHQEGDEHHPRSSRRRSTSIESCSRRTWTTTASMMSTITSTSRKTPASTMPGRPYVARIATPKIPLSKTTTAATSKRPRRCASTPTVLARAASKSDCAAKSRSRAGQLCRQTISSVINSPRNARRFDAVVIERGIRP